MKREELLYIKSELQKEIERRNRIKELLQEEKLQEFITLTNMDSNEYVKEDYELLKKILDNFEITETNRIYVCIDAYYYGLEEDVDNLNLIFQILNSRIYDKRLYKDIENGKQILGCTDKVDCLYFSDRVYDKDFNKENIVLNPYNTRKNQNGYEEVRRMFFENAIKYGQVKSKKLLLSKYPRL